MKIKIIAQLEETFKLTIITNNIIIINYYESDFNNKFIICKSNSIKIAYFET